MPRNILLGLGLALSPATQFRLGSLPIGAAELLLSAWILLTATTLLTLGPGTTNPTLWRIGTFWAVLVFAESAALVFGFAVDLFQDVPAMLHDVVAYLLMMTLGILLALDLHDPVRRRNACWMFVGLGTAVLLLQLASGIGLNLLPGIEGWYFDRFRGWSENPNQLGFFAVVLALASLHLAQTARSAGEAVGAFACLGVAGLAGILSRSDSFMVALLIGSSAWVALTALTWFQTLRSGLLLRGAAVLFALLSLPLAAAAFAPFAAAALERIEQTSEILYSDNDQGETRLSLWLEALDRGFQSGFIGYGPGPQLTSKSYKRPPPSKFEAHNTLLDLFVQGGLLAVGVFAWLCLVALMEAWRARLAGLAAMVCALTVFGMFHLVVRQPLFWFGLLLCLHEAARVMLATGRKHRVSPSGVGT